jgi:hypothetical protein
MWDTTNLDLFCDLRKTHVERCGIPHLAKNERDTPNFLYAAPDNAACAPFIKERRMKFAEANKPHRKSEIWGTPRFVEGRRRTTVFRLRVGIFSLKNKRLLRLVKHASNNLWSVQST